MLEADGAHRAASKSVISSSLEIFSPDIARGECLCKNMSSIGYSVVLPFIILFTYSVYTMCQACYNINMNDRLWGKYLVEAYGVLLLFYFLFNHFQFWKAIVWGSYPLIALLESSPDSVIYISINFGLYGISILCILVQGLFLYYLGKILQKLFKKS